MRPLRLALTAVSLAPETGLWSAVQAVNAEARASYDAAAATLGDMGFPCAHLREGFTGWHALNDTVMGGRSSGTCRATNCGLELDAEVARLQTLVADEGGFDAATAQAIAAGRTRPHGHLLPETLAAHQGLAEAGCAEVALGAESCSDPILSSLNKRFTTAEVRRVTERFAAAGVRRVGFLMLGVPGETRPPVSSV